MASASGAGGPQQASAPSRQTAAQTPPKTLGKYELRKKIGAGGMGTVYLAFDTQLKRTVALKVLPQEKANNPTLVKRFRSEAEAAAQLKHDNIVTIYEAGQTDRYLFIALEYVDGTDVFKLLGSRGVLPVKRSLDIVKQVARALQHAHARNIVHRDIKPSNLLIQRDGTVKLTDMGLARSVDDSTETNITRAGMTVGTVDYMAPEQARDSKAADIRSDIYSLGCTWYHMLTGGPPFSEGSVTNKLYGHATKPRPDPRDKNEAVPEGVVEILHRMMARKPADRYQTPKELLADLENVDTRPVSAAEKLLATISDVVDSEADEETAAGSPAETGGGLPSRRLRAGAAKTGDPDRDWVKYVVGGGVFIVFAGLIWWISSQFGGTLDSPGALITRGGDADDLSGEDGGDSAGGDASQPTDDAPSAIPDSSAGTNTDVAADETAPTSDGSAPTAPVRIPQGQQDTAIYGGVTDPRLLEKIDVGRNGEKDYMPNWVVGSISPDRASASSPAAKLPTLTVGRTSGEPSQFADLNSALDGLPPEGGTIQLIGDGPFDLGPVRINGGLVVITAAKPDQPDPAHRPLVVFQPDPVNANRPVVTLEGGSLALLDVHLSASAQRFGERGSATLIDVRGGDLTVRRCSLTLLGSRQGPIVAFGTSIADGDTSGSRPGRLLLDRTCVRGDLTAVSIGGGAVDLLAVNSLFATGSAPIARVSGGLPAAQASSTNRSSRNRRSETPQRLLRFISCTGAAARTAFEFTPGSGGEELPVTRVLALNSLFSAPPVDGEPAFVLLHNWPLSESRAAGESLFRRLHWSVRNTVGLGWASLLRHDSDPPLRVTGIAQWQNTWRTLVEASQFLQVSWPADAIDDPAHLPPVALDSVTAGVQQVTATDGGLPGCNVAAMIVPDDDLLLRVAATSERPFPPPALFPQTEPAKVVAVDLNKGEDLGRVVSGTDWPSGTLFVVSGSGPRTSRPMRVRGKRARIEFRQTEGAPLLVSARPVNLDVVGEVGPMADAFITVSGGGRIEIANANFRIPRSTSVPYPSWLLYAEDGSFALDGCVIEGPVIGNSRNKGLIRWGRPQQATNLRSVPGGARRSTKNMEAGRYEHTGEIRGSFLKGGGKLFELDIAERALMVTGSVLVSTGGLFDLNITGSEPRIRGAIDVDHSTLAAEETFFKIWSTPRSQSATFPLRLFVEESIFIPTRNAASDDGLTLLAYTVPAVRRERQVEWWGQNNGYTPVIRKYLDGPAEPAGRGGDFEKSWRSLWPPTACLRPLRTGLSESGSVAGAVALKAPLPSPSRLEAADFELHASAKANGWSIDGKPIGADIRSVRRAGPSSAATSEPHADPGDKKKGPRKPSF